MTDQTKLGSKINTLRTALGISIEELSNRCGCAVETIEGLEAGELLPSLEPLIKLSRGLGVRLGTLLDDEEVSGPIHTDTDTVLEVTRMKSLETQSAGSDLVYYSLAAGKPSRSIDPFLITITPSGEASTKLVPHEGEEFLYCLEGRFIVDYGGDVTVVNPGESIYYDAVVPHQVRAFENETAKFIAVTYNPA